MSLALTAVLSVSPAQAELPVICVTGATCGNSSGIINNALSGVSGIAVAGNAMTINQNAANANSIFGILAPRIARVGVVVTF